MKKIILLILVVIFIYYAGSGLLAIIKKNPPNIIDFVSCQNAGRPIMESYPRQCQGLNGKVYVEKIDNKNLNTDPIILSPDLSRPLTSPLNIAGEARGFWFFEAIFSVKLVDDKGNLIATGTAKAKGEWTTTEFVPFNVTLNFKNPNTKTGELILIKSNPSGLASQEREVRLPVFFQKINEIGNKVQINASTTKDEKEATTTAD